MLVVLLLACAGSPPPAPGCGSCHSDAPPGVHATIPCQICHLGHADATEREQAHAGMEREPGALDTVGSTCGTCHPIEMARVRTVPMTTGRGLVGVDRFVFGELPTPDTEQTLADVLATATPSPAEDHLRRLCAGCHLGTRRDNRDAAVTGGSGCSACHSVAAAGHPAITAKVPDSQCQGCHSRSSRISLTYAGQVEGPCDTKLPDGRTTCATTPDVHAAAGLACIDCHVHTELMGDGVSRAHQEEQVEVRCTSCHGYSSPPPNLQDPITLRLPHTDIVATGVRGTPLWNVSATGLTGKLDGRSHPVARVSSTHAGRGHERLECTACHSPVAPVCTTCHTSYTPSGKQWDFGLGREVAGRWVESGATETLVAPALGVGADDRIRPAIPGMIGDINGRSVRRFALLDPHSTQRHARTCADCHQSAVALGLGSGTLDLATFRFTPTNAVPGFLNLAADGWTTLGAATPGEGTRVGVRSLNTGEQQRILRVGVCLGCHEGNTIEAWTSLDAQPARCTIGRGWWNESFH